MPRSRFDFKWFKDHLVAGFLSDRVEGSLGPEGCLMSYWEMRRSPKGSRRSHVIAQSRAVYDLARGYQLTGKRELLRRAQRAGRFLIDRFLDREYGGYYEMVGADGEVIDSDKRSYGNTHVVFGLSHLARATGDAEYRREAFRSWDFIKEHLADERGGMIYGLKRDLSPAKGHKSQNPIMHVFEGLLGLGDLDGARHIYKEAEGISRFMIDVLLGDDYVLPEYYTDDWGVLPGKKGGQVFVGHAFEWAYFLAMAADRGFPARYLKIAERMIEKGLEIGYDRSDGCVFSYTFPEGPLASRDKSYWEQCEALRAMLHFAILRGRDDLWPYIDAIAEGIRDKFIDGRTHAWRLAVKGDGTPVPERGWLKLDYHAIGLCAEVMRLARYV